MHETLRLAMMISGGGTTTEALVNASKESGLLYGKVEPVVVIASKPDARGIQKAEKLGVPVRIVERKQFEKGLAGLEAFGWVILAYLKEFETQYVSQNGWLPLTPANVIEEYEGHILNQHPGPLDPDHLGSDGRPSHFGGKGMHGLTVPAAVLEFQRLTGRVFPSEATIHRVSPDFDRGTVVARQEVAVLNGDTPESLAARMLPVEHSLQIRFWENVFQNNVTELHRNEPLIYQGEEQFLQQAIIYARDAYPNG